MVLLETHSLLFQPGLVVNQEFFDYNIMQESAKNWSYTLKYRLGTGAFYGYHDGIQLHHLQFGHSSQYEGMMYEGLSPKDCLTIGLLQENRGTVYINHLKMEVDDIIVIDDSKVYDYVASHGTLLTIVSIHKTLIEKETPWMKNNINKKFKDKDNILSKTIESEWKHVLNDPSISQSNERLEMLEKKILNAIKNTFTGQIGRVSHLTKAEQTTLEIKSYLLDSINEDITVQSIVKQFGISDKTLETCFKSLFGITPKIFLKLLKLNKAHEDLQFTTPQTTNVSDIASKWGFSHFGRFAKDYEGLFGVLPSETLAIHQTHI